MSAPLLHAIALNPAAGAAVFSVLASATMVLNASNKKLGFKYFPPTTSPIVSADLYCAITGAPGSLRIGAFADDAGAPGATQLGGWTDAFAAPGASGFTGAKTFGTSTGNLTLNVPVWIVAEPTSGTWDASNAITAAAIGVASGGGCIAPWRVGVRLHNGTDWTTVALTQFAALLVVTHADGTVNGFPFAAGAGRAGVADIFVNGGSNQVQGLRFRVGAPGYLGGAVVHPAKAGAPENLVMAAYQNDVLIATQTIPAASIVTNTAHRLRFATPPLILPGRDAYLLLSQAGTSDSNDYDLHTLTVAEAYLPAVLPANMRFVSGVLTVPSALTVSATEVPMISPLILGVEDGLVGGPHNPFGGGFIS